MLLTKRLSIGDAGRIMPSYKFLLAAALLGLFHPNPLRADEYRDLLRKFEQEIRSYLYPDQPVDE